MSRLLILLLLGATPATSRLNEMAPTPPHQTIVTTMNRAEIACNVRKAPEELEEERIAHILKEGTLTERAVLRAQLEEKAKAEAEAKAEAPKPHPSPLPCDALARK